MKTIVVTNKAKNIMEFDNFEEAQKIYPELRKNTNGSRFTCGMYDKQNGIEVKLFEDWSTYEVLSI